MWTIGSFYYYMLSNQDLQEEDETNEKKGRDFHMKSFPF